MNKKNTSFYLLSLLVIGFFAKFISLSNRIVLSRTIGIGAMSLFTLVNPLIVLLITFSSLSLPTVVATLIAKKPQESKKIFISAFTLIMSIAIILMILIFFLSEFIASNMLHNKQSVEAIKACCLLIPLVSLSSKRLFSWEQRSSSHFIFANFRRRQSFDFHRCFFQLFYDAKRR